MGAAGGSLRAKYMDWCSARIAERLLDLDPEEMYELARRPEVSVPGQVASGGEATYRELVQRATEAILERLPLPPFEEWSRDYAKDPAKYDADLLGLWRETSGGGAGDGGA